MKACLGRLLVIAVVLPAAFAGPIPDPAANRIYLFASSTTRESLTDQDAEKRLASFEQRNATAVADRAACALAENVHIGDSLGIYDASSENSFILEADLERKQSEYLAALLGLYSRQEFILLFLEEAGGSDRLWIVETPQSLGMVISALRRLKLTPVTVRTDKDRNEIWLVDPGGKRAETLKNFAFDVNGRASVTPGSAETLGDRRRIVAVKRWREQIRAFEQHSGSRLSRQLSSKGWREATLAHTCSTELSLP
jgi:hypothetical protein